MRIMHPKLICTIYMQKETMGIHPGHIPNSNTTVWWSPPLTQLRHSSNACDTALLSTNEHNWGIQVEYSGALGNTTQVSEAPNRTCPSTQTQPALCDMWTPPLNTTMRQHKGAYQKWTTPAMWYCLARHWPRTAVLHLQTNLIHTPMQWCNTYYKKMITTMHCP